MTTRTYKTTPALLASILLGAAGPVGCDADGDGYDPSDDAALSQDSDEGPASMDLALLDAIAEAPDIRDEDVEALFSNANPTVRDVIRLFDLESLPAELTVEDLDRPIELRLTDPPSDAVQGEQIEGDESGLLTAAAAPLQLGEQACATASLADANDGTTIQMGPSPSCGVTQDGSTSPTTNYDPRRCPDQYITQVSGTYGRSLEFYSDWHGIQLDETYCELSSLATSAYGGTWVLENFNGNWSATLEWTALGTTREHGSWQPPGPFPVISGCSWDYDNGYGPLPYLTSGHGYSRVRIATRGIVLALVPFKQRVEGGVSHGSGPC